jgi:hypothetical protein
MPHQKPNVAELVNQMPEVDRPGHPSKFTAPDPDAAAKIFDEILSRKESLIELLELVREPADPDFENYKAGYVLHGIAIHVGRRDKEKQRKMFSETLASRLGNEKHSKDTREFFIRELQFVGGPDAVSALGKHLLDEQLSEPATQALLAIGKGAADPIRQALGKAAGRVRITLAQAAGVVRDSGAVPLLAPLLKNDDRDTRIIAAWSLARIAEPASVDALLELADGSEGWERQQATKSCLLLADTLAAKGNKTQSNRIYQHLRETRKDDRFLLETIENRS